MAPKKMKSQKEGPVWAKHNLQAILDNPLSSYDERIRMMVIILRNSFLNKPLTNSTSDIPEEHIIKAFHSASYDLDSKRVNFSLFDDSKAFITKDLYKLSIGIQDVIPPTVDPVTGIKIHAPYCQKPTDDEVRSFLLELGYDENPPNIADIKKAKLPVQWHFAVNLLIRCVAWKTGGLDSIVKDLLMLLWALYYNKNIDVAQILFDDFVKSVTKKDKNDGEILLGRYWALVLKGAYNIKSSLVIDKTLDTFKPSPLDKYLRNDTCPGDVRILPQHLLDLIGADSKIVKDYLKNSAHLLKPFEDVPAVLLSTADDDVTLVSPKKRKRKDPRTKIKTEQDSKPKSKPTTEDIFSKLSKKSTDGSGSAKEPTVEIDDDANEEDEEEDRLIRKRIKVDLGKETVITPELMTMYKSMSSTKEPKQDKQPTIFDLLRKKKEKQQAAAEKRRLEEEEAKNAVDEILGEKPTEEEKPTDDTPLNEGGDDNTMELSFHVSAHSSPIKAASASVCSNPFAFSSDTKSQQPQSPPQESKQSQSQEQSQPQQTPPKKRRFKRTTAGSSKHQLRMLTSKLKTVEHKLNTEALHRNHFKVLNNKLNRLINKPTPPPPVPTPEEIKVMTDIFKQSSQSIVDAVKDLAKETTDLIKPTISDSTKEISALKAQIETFITKLDKESNFVIEKQQKDLDELRKKVRELTAENKQIAVDRTADSFATKLNTFSESLAKTFTVVFGTHSADVKDIIKEHLESIVKLVEGLKSADVKGGEKKNGEGTEDDIVPPMGDDAAGSSGTKEETEEERQYRLKAEQELADKIFAEKMQKEEDAKRAEEEEERLAQLEAQKAADELAARKLAEEDDRLLNEDPDPIERTEPIHREIFSSKLTAADIVPVQTYAIPESSIYTLDLPIYGSNRPIYMMDPIPPTPGETSQHLTKRETDRAVAFYNKHCHPAEDLVSRSKVSGATKPTCRMFQKSRYVVFTIKRFDNSVLEVTSGDFPHMNPLDIFDVLKLYRKATGNRESQAVRHHKSVMKRFLSFYTFDFGSLDAVLQPEFFSEMSEPPPAPNTSADAFPIKAFCYTEDPEKAILYRLKSQRDKWYAFRFAEKHLYDDKGIKQMVNLLKKLNLPADVETDAVGELLWFLEVRKIWYQMTKFVKN